MKPFAAELVAGLCVRVPRSDIIVEGGRMPKSALANFVETQNIARFKSLLETESHPDKRRILTLLLAEEEAKHTSRIEARELDRIAMHCPTKYRH